MDGTVDRFAQSILECQRRYGCQFLQQFPRRFLRGEPRRMIGVDRATPGCRADCDAQPAANERKKNRQFVIIKRPFGVVCKHHVDGQADRIVHIHHHVSERNGQFTNRGIPQTIAKIQQPRHLARRHKHVLMVHIAVNHRMTEGGKSRLRRRELLKRMFNDSRVIWVDNVCHQTAVLGSTGQVPMVGSMGTAMIKALE